MRTIESSTSREALIEGLDEGARAANQNNSKAKRLKCWGICLLILGIACLVTSFTVPFMTDQYVTDKIRYGTMITQANEPLWRETLSGAGEVDILRHHYLHNVTNYEEVIYGGAAPTYQEVGPFTYKEVNSYDQIKYDQSVKDARTGAHSQAVQALFTQRLEPLLDPKTGSAANGLESEIERPMYVANQASLAYWHSQTKLKPKWETYLQLLFAMVQEELGHDTLELATAKLMRQTRLNRAGKINEVLLPGNPVSSQTATKMMKDQFYGLEREESYIVWSALLPSANAHTRLVFLWELRTYFGLSFAQVEELQANWVTIHDQIASEVLTQLPQSSQDDQTRVAYWQWASSQLTSRYFGAASLTKLTNSSFAGYPEMSYFLATAFKQGVDWRNQKALGGVRFNETGYEHLFSLGQENNPDESSLFNMDTMQKLCTLGAVVPNIMTNQAAMIGTTFHLSTEWLELAQTLRLPNEEYVYMIWLWMETAWEQSYLRSQDGGTVELETLSRRGAQAFKDTMTTMRLEVPLLSMATELEKQTKGMDCAEIYTQEFALSASTAETLCTQTQNFTFAESNRFRSAFALVNVYLYADQFNPWYYQEFVSAALPESTATSLMTLYEEDTFEFAYLQSTFDHDHHPWQTISEFTPELYGQAKEITPPVQRPFIEEGGSEMIAWGYPFFRPEEVFERGLKEAGVERKNQTEVDGQDPIDTYLGGTTDEKLDQGSPWGQLVAPKNETGPLKDEKDSEKAQPQKLVEVPATENEKSPHVFVTKPMNQTQAKATEETETLPSTEAKPKKVAELDLDKEVTAPTNSTQKVQFVQPEQLVSPSPDQSAKLGKHESQKNSTQVPDPSPSPEPVAVKNSTDSSLQEPELEPTDSKPIIAAPKVDQPSKPEQVKKKESTPWSKLVPSSQKEAPVALEPTQSDPTPLNQTTYAQPELERVSEHLKAPEVAAVNATEPVESKETTPSETPAPPLSIPEAPIADPLQSQVVQKTNSTEVVDQKPEVKVIPQQPALNSTVTEAVQPVKEVPKSDPTKKVEEFTLQPPEKEMQPDLDQKQMRNDTKPIKEEPQEQLLDLKPSVEIAKPTLVSNSTQLTDPEVIVLKPQIAEPVVKPAAETPKPKMVIEGESPWSKLVPETKQKDPVSLQPAKSDPTPLNQTESVLPEQTRPIDTEPTVAANSTEPIGVKPKTPSPPKEPIDVPLTEKAPLTNSTDVAEQKPYKKTIIQQPSLKSQPTQNSTQTEIVQPEEPEGKIQTPVEGPEKKSQPESDPVQLRNDTQALSEKSKEQELDPLPEVEAVKPALVSNSTRQIQPRPKNPEPELTEPVITSEARTSKPEMVIEGESPWSKLVPVTKQEDPLKEEAKAPFNQTQVSPASDPKSATKFKTKEPPQVAPVNVTAPEITVSTSEPLVEPPTLPSKSETSIQGPLPAPVQPQTNTTTVDVTPTIAVIPQDPTHQPKPVQNTTEPLTIKPEVKVAQLNETRIEQAPEFTPKKELPPQTPPLQKQNMTTVEGQESPWSKLVPVTQPEDPSAADVKADPMPLNQKETIHGSDSESTKGIKEPPQVLPVNATATEITFSKKEPVVASPVTETAVTPDPAPTAGDKLTNSTIVDEKLVEELQPTVPIKQPKLVSNSTGHIEAQPEVEVVKLNKTGTEQAALEPPRKEFQPQTPPVQGQNLTVVDSQEPVKPMPAPIVDVKEPPQAQNSTESAPVSQPMSPTKPVSRAAEVIEPSTTTNSTASPESSPQPIATEKPSPPFKPQKSIFQTPDKEQPKVTQPQVTPEPIVQPMQQPVTEEPIVVKPIEVQKETLTPPRVDLAKETETKTSQNSTVAEKPEQVAEKKQAKEVEKPQSSAEKEAPWDKLIDVKTNKTEVVKQPSVKEKPTAVIQPIAKNQTEPEKSIQEPIEQKQPDQKAPEPVPQVDTEPHIQPTPLNSTEVLTPSRTPFKPQIDPTPPQNITESTPVPPFKHPSESASTPSPTLVPIVVTPKEKDPLNVTNSTKPPASDFLSGPKPPSLQSTLSSNFTDMMYAPASPFESTMTSIQSQIAKSQPSVCASDQPFQVCAFSNLTYAQWLDSSLLKDTHQGYVSYYSLYSQLHLTPEFGVFAFKSEGVDMPSDVGTQVAYREFNGLGMFNQRNYYDTLVTGQSHEANALKTDQQPLVQDYLKFVSVNFGLESVFTKRSPRELIEGYEDPLLADVVSRDLYRQGDVRTSQMVNLGRGKAYPNKGSVTVQQGGSKSSPQTRQVVDRLGQPDITVPERLWETPTSVIEVPQSPFDTQILLDGTDGFQFQPNVNSDKPLTFYSPDWTRNVELKFEVLEDTYKQLETLKYSVDPAVWLSKEQNADNLKYATEYSGSMNVTQVLGANSIVTKGHYMDLDTTKLALPTILNITGQPVSLEDANADEDDSWIGVEGYTGIPLVWRQRSFYNYVVEDADQLLGLPKSTSDRSQKAALVPLAYVKREYTWTQEQVHEQLDIDLLYALRWKWPLFGSLASIGLILILFSSWLLSKGSRLKEEQTEKQARDGAIGVNSANSYAKLEQTTS